MKHSGKAFKAAGRILLLGFVLFVVLGAILGVAGLGSGLAGGIAGVPFVAFALFTLYFFRDPEARVPSGPGIVVAPAHGKIDIIDEIDEPKVMGGRCRRISIFLSVFDVHVQQAPVSGRVTLVEHTPGKFLNAMKAESATENENVLIGFESTDPKVRRIGVRLLTGLIARRIIPWARADETVAKGERISLIQFGSRVDLYLPLEAVVAVKLGDRAVGGETLMARVG
jgi:phosphatidylserine decarboxylase